LFKHPSPTQLLSLVRHSFRHQAARLGLTLQQGSVASYS